MSYDQRPGKLRVVQQKGGAPAPQQAGEDAAAAADAAAGLPAPGTAPATGSEKLPLLGAALFLLACAGGGVALAVIRPFGIG